MHSPGPTAAPIGQRWALLLPFVTNTFSDDHDGAVCIRVCSAWTRAKGIGPDQLMAVIADLGLRKAEDDCVRVAEVVQRLEAIHA